MSVYFHHSDKTITILGQTYPHRQAIKSLGARFVGGQKVWEVPMSKESLKAVSDLCLSLGGGQHLFNKKEKEKELAPNIQETNSPLSKKNENQTAPLFPIPHFPEQTSKQEASYTLIQLMERIHGVITKNFKEELWVVGEVQNINFHSRAIYFNLAEEDLSKKQKATISVSCIIWKNQWHQLKEKLGEETLKSILADGLKVRCKCQVGFYRGRASISLTLIDLDPKYTKGALALAREALLAELRQKGLDKKNKQRPLSCFPLKIGVLSAPGSRALSDFLHQLDVGHYPGKIYVLPVSMQGEKTSSQVLRGIEKLNSLACDLIVLTRGGGSAADLRYFDLPEIAFAVAKSKLPIIAAIGHHDDYCIAEEIAYERRKTPTAAADFIIEKILSVKERIQSACGRLSQDLQRLTKVEEKHQNQMLSQINLASQQIIGRKKQVLLSLSAHLKQTLILQQTKADAKLKEVKLQLQQKSSEKLKEEDLRLKDKLEPQIYNLSQHLLNLEMTRLEKYIGELKAHDPSPWIKSGWTRLELKNKSLLSIETVKLGDELTARLCDGTLKLKVLAKKN